MFEQASREKFRYESCRGMLTTEDLWDLPLASDNGLSLDSVARIINRVIKQEEEESFVVKENNKLATHRAKLEVVKHVIAYKMQKAEEAEKAAANRAKKQQILEIIADKQADELKGKSIKTLQNMINEL